MEKEEVKGKEPESAGNGSNRRVSGKVVIDVDKELEQEEKRIEQRRIAKLTNSLSNNALPDKVDRPNDLKHFSSEGTFGSNISRLQESGKLHESSEKEKLISSPHVIIRYESETKLESKPEEEKDKKDQPFMATPIDSTNRLKTGTLKTELTETSITDKTSQQPLLRNGDDAAASSTSELLTLEHSGKGKGPVFENGTSNSFAIIQRDYSTHPYIIKFDETYEGDIANFSKLSKNEFEFIVTEINSILRNSGQMKFSDTFCGFLGLITCWTFGIIIPTPSHITQNKLITFINYQNDFAIKRHGIKILNPVDNGLQYIKIITIPTSDTTNEIPLL